MRPAARLPAALVVLAALAGCREASYVVLEDGTPLYRAPTGTDVVARLPRYHHEVLEDDPVDDEASTDRYRLAFRGARGWAPRRGVKVFEYLSPEWDDGAARDAATRRELREAQLADRGRGWGAREVEAVRAERVVVGMTRDQAELAWGWPTTVEPFQGGERWVWREASTRDVNRWADPWPWGGGWTWGAWGGPWPGYGYGYGPCHDEWWTVRMGPTWVTVSMPVTVERIAEFDAAGRVTRVDERTLLDGR